MKSMTPDEVSAWSPPYGRRRGWQDTLSRAGLPAPPEWKVSGQVDIEGGRASTQTLMRQAPEVTALFAASDEMAMGALLAARAAGRRVPEDLSVIGVDDHDAAEVLGLSTIRQSAGVQGGDAARVLLELIGGGEVPDPATTLHPIELVVRTSTARLAE